jgi:hypothetical protein
VLSLDLCLRLSLLLRRVAAPRPLVARPAALSATPPSRRVSGAGRGVGVRDGARAPLALQSGTHARTHTSLHAVFPVYPPHHPVSFSLPVIQSLFLPPYLFSPPPHQPVSLFPSHHPVSSSRKSLISHVPPRLNIFSPSAPFMYPPHASAPSFSCDSRSRVSCAPPGAAMSATDSCASCRSRVAVSCALLVSPAHPVVLRLASLLVASMHNFAHASPTRRPSTAARQSMTVSPRRRRVSLGPLRCRAASAPPLRCLCAVSPLCGFCAVSPRGRASPSPSTHCSSASAAAPGACRGPAQRATYSSERVALASGPGSLASGHLPRAPAHSPRATCLGSGSLASGLGPRLDPRPVTRPASACCRMCPGRRCRGWPGRHGGAWRGKLRSRNWDSRGSELGQWGE